MKKIIECIPNFSEGRDLKKIASIVEAITAVKGVFFLGSESDGDHNRSVVTFAGSPEAVLEAAFQAIKKAGELIDLNKHEGEHPRMGSTDVCPLVPIKGVKEAECVEYAKKLAERVGKELKIPTYLYEKAAQKPERENLANVRKGQYEGIKAEIGKDSSRKPDFGPSKLGSAGATAIGVRIPLLAYNVNLATDNLKIAKAIAKTVRAKTGGFTFVKAMGFALEDKGIVQVSMNLTNYKKSKVHTVFEAIKREAHRYGVQVLESEVIGLIPQKALVDAAKYYLQINDLKNKQILETAIQKQVERSTVTLDGFLDQTASKKPVPGGGSVSALSGALAAALSTMVANLTLARDKYKKVHPEMARALKKTETLRTRLYELIEEDSQAYKAVVAAYKEGKDSKIQKASKLAAATPLEIAETAIKLLDPLKILAEKGNPNAITDCGVAAHMIESAVKGAILNVRINLKEISSKPFNKEMNEACEKLKNTLDKKTSKIEEVVESKL
jgi:glutamate formiminotransferase / formiminotetrahydrofolate cyclodeaminase